jgi:myosin-5
MTSLTHLHEPGVLHNLHTRFLQDKIYTLTGAILIAINPFKHIPQLLAPGVMQAYEQQVLPPGAAGTDDAGGSGGGSGGTGQRLPPHVFGVAVAAYGQMMRHGAGQAILVSVVQQSM